MFNKSSESNKKNSNLALLIIVSLFSIYSLFSYYPLITMYVGFILLVMVKAFPLNFFPPVMFYFWGTHLLQIFGVVILADSDGHTAEYIFDVENIDKLIFITLTQFLAMVLITALLIKKKVSPSLLHFKALAQKINEKKIIFAYIISTITFPLIISGDNAGVINQLIQAFSSLRYSFLILLFFSLILKTESKFKTIIILLFIVEFLISFISYFSSFKMVVIIILLTYLTIYPKISISTLFRSVFAIIFLFLFMSFWTAVKTDYRDFLNKGTRTQSIQVSRNDAINFLSDKVENFTIDQFKEGNFNLLKRIQYIEQYSYVYKNVPQNIPFQGGDNIFDAIKFVFIPRFLNAEKGILDPSIKTTKYTKVSYSSFSDGTSISMGYFADFYIDYGFYLMIIPLFVIVAIISLSYNFVLSNKKYNTLFNYALLIAIFPSIGAFESDIIFFLGILKNYIVMFIIGNLFIFPWLYKQFFSNSDTQFK